MRHARPDDLHAVEPLLVQLRSIERLTERKPGNFSLGSRAFLHFHVDGDDMYADARIDGRAFERFRVSTPAEWDALVLAVRAALSGGARPGAGH